MVTTGVFRFFHWFQLNRGAYDPHRQYRTNSARQCTWFAFRNVIMEEAPYHASFLLVVLPVSEPRHSDSLRPPACGIAPGCVTRVCVLLGESPA